MANEPDNPLRITVRPRSDDFAQVAENGPWQQFKSPDPVGQPWTQYAPVKATPYETQLSPAEEQQFNTWKQQNAPNDSGADYDLRGAFKAGLSPAANGHWPDTFKKPNHPTFSVESVYAKERPEMAGSWNGEQYVPAGPWARFQPPQAPAQAEGPAVSPPAPLPGTPASAEGSSTVPADPVAPRGFFDKLLGLTGERHQLWPERMVREGSAVVEGAQSGAYGAPGSAEFSQNVVPDVLKHLMPLAVSGAPSRVPGGGAPPEAAPIAAEAPTAAAAAPPVPPSPPAAPTAPTPPAASQPGFLTRMAQGAEKIFSPETVDANADAAVSAIRAATGKAARDTAVTNAALEPYHARVNALPPDRQLDFISSVEGRSKPDAKAIDPELKPVADELRTAFEQRRAKIEELPEHEGMSFVDDYYPHMWQDPNKAAGIINQYRGAPSRQGSGASLKSRTVPTMAEGIEQGLVPVTTNPIDGALRYIQSMDLFIANAQVRNAGKEQGLIRYIRPQIMGASGHPDSFKVPEGWAPLKGRGATDAMGAQAYAPEGYARVYNNFISRGFHDLDPALGDAVAGGQRVSNAITALELGLSGYHALTMMQEAMVNQLARGIGNLRGGKPIEAAKDIVGTPLAPITRAVQGNKLRDVYLGKSEGTPEARQIADLLEQGGGRAKGFRHSPDYEFSGAGSYWTAFKRGALKSQLIGDAKDIAGHPVSGPLAVGARHIGRIMDTVAQPIFEKYIPAIKNGAFYENMSAWLQQNPAAPREQQVRAARQILDSIDNRFGEMVQDNVFWNKALKQVAMLALRSWSWTVGGSFREIGAGVRDTLRAPFKSVNAENLGPNDKRWTQKMDYIIALPVVYGGLSAVYQYIKTGKPPEEVRDLLAPRTGGVDANSGEPERLLIPGYMKDVYGFIEHPWQEMKYKAATAPTKMFEVLDNKNWRGDPIRSPRDWGGAERGWLGEQESALAHAPQWMKDYWKYTTESFGPITVRNLTRGQKEGSNLNAVETGLGVRTAPRQFIDPEGYGKMLEGLSRRDWQKKLNFEKREKQRYGGTE